MMEEEGGGFYIHHEEEGEEGEEGGATQPQLPHPVAHSTPHTILIKRKASTSPAFLRFQEADLRLEKASTREQQLLGLGGGGGGGGGGGEGGAGAGELVRPFFMAEEGKEEGDGERMRMEEEEDDEERGTVPQEEEEGGEEGEGDMEVVGTA